MAYRMSPNRKAWFVLTSRRYCDFLKLDPQKCFESVSLKFLYFFFDWMLSQKKARKGGRSAEQKRAVPLGRTGRSTGSSTRGLRATSLMRR